MLQDQQMSIMIQGILQPLLDMNLQPRQISKVEIYIEMLSLIRRKHLLGHGQE